MGAYLTARERYMALKAEYDRKLRELDPLKWKMKEAKIEADKQWKLVVERATVAST